MALSTVTISQTMEWAKKLSFNRLSAIGNNLEPALTSANMVMQTILGPPFSWWWNNLELTFTTNATPNAAVITNITIASGIATITTANTFGVGNLLIPAGLTAIPALNGVMLLVSPGSTATTVIASVKLPDHVSVAETGTLTNATTQDYTVSAPT